MTDTAEDLRALRALEALFFVSDEPLTTAVLASALEVDRRTVDDLCAALQARLEERGSASCCATSPADGACTRTPTPRDRRAVRPVVPAGPPDEGGAWRRSPSSRTSNPSHATRSRDPRRELRRRDPRAAGPRPRRGDRPRGGSRAADAVRHLAGVPRAPRAAVTGRAAVPRAAAGRRRREETRPMRSPTRAATTGPEIAEDDGVEIMADMVDGPASEPRSSSGGGGAPPARPRPRRSRLPAIQRGADRGGPRHRQRDGRDARRQGRYRPGPRDRRRRHPEPRPEHEVLRAPQAGRAW
jgi:hypothetical protein